MAEEAAVVEEDGAEASASVFDGLEVGAAGDAGTTDAGADAGSTASTATDSEYEHEFLQDYQGGKYRTLEAMTDAHKSAQHTIQELKERMGGFAGAPTDEAGNFSGYEFTLPDGWDGELDADSPEMTAFVEFGKRNNMSNDVAQDALENVLIPVLQGLAAATHEEVQASLATEYGSAELAAQAVEESFSWAAPHMSPKGLERLKSLGSHPDAVPVLTELKASLTATKLGRGEVGGADAVEKRYFELLHDPTTAGDTNKSAELARLANQRAGTS